MSSSNQPLRYETEISNSKSLISPSLESESTYFTNRTGGKGKYAPASFLYRERFFYVL